MTAVIKRVPFFMAPGISWDFYGDGWQAHTMYWTQTVLPALTSTSHLPV